MKKLASGLEILKEESTKSGNMIVSLTRKTNKAGEIKHGVVLTNPVSGRHRKVRTFDGVSGAMAVYKALVNA